MSADLETEEYGPPEYGWVRNKFGRHIPPTERELIQELARTHRLDVEAREKAYLFSSPAWEGQVLRMSYAVVCWPRSEVLRAFGKVIESFPLPSRYAGLFLKKLRGDTPDAYLLRTEHRDRLEA